VRREGKRFLRWGGGDPGRGSGEFKGEAPRRCGKKKKGKDPKQAVWRISYVRGGGIFPGKKKGGEHLVFKGEGESGERGKRSRARGGGTLSCPKKKFEKIRKEIGTGEGRGFN